METLDISEIKPMKRILVEFVDRTYWFDYVVVGMDGSLTAGCFVNEITKETFHDPVKLGEEPMIVTRIELNGMIIHDFAGEVKFKDLVMMQRYTEEMLHKEYVKQTDGSYVDDDDDDDGPDVPYVKEKVPSYDGGDYA
jgi:hypothetical protein